MSMSPSMTGPDLTRRERRRGLVWGHEHRLDRVFRVSAGHRGPPRRAALLRGGRPARGLLPRDRPAPPRRPPPPASPPPRGGAAGPARPAPPPRAAPPPGPPPRAP